MSAYVTIDVEFKDKDCLVESLKALGVKEDHIELSDEGTALYGYQGDKRDETANVIIRRKNLGRLSNDFGFKREGDGYKMLLSEYDHSVVPKKLGAKNKDDLVAKLKGGYSEAFALKQAKTYGYTPVVTKTPTKTVIKLTKW